MDEITWLLLAGCVLGLGFLACNLAYRSGVVDGFKYRGDPLHPNARLVRQIVADAVSWRWNKAQFDDYEALQAEEAQRQAGNPRAGPFRAPIV